MASGLFSRCKAIPRDGRFRRKNLKLQKCELIRQLDFCLLWDLLTLDFDFLSGIARDSRLRK